MKQNGTSGTALTTSLGLSSSSVSEWKKGKIKPSADAIVKLSVFFDVSTDWLLTGSERNAPYIPPEDFELLARFRALPPAKRKAIEALLE